jgi:hypothetical protein
LKAFAGPDHAPAMGDAFSCTRATATDTCSLVVRGIEAMPAGASASLRLCHALSQAISPGGRRLLATQLAGNSAREIALEKRVGSRQSVGIELGACSQASGARRAKGEEHENCKRTFGCTFGGAIGNSVRIASRGGKRTKEHSQFKVHLTGSKAISASSPEDEKSYRVIQSLHDCCRLPSVRTAAFGIASEERKSRLLLLLRPALPSSPCASVRIGTRHSIPVTIEVR